MPPQPSGDNSWSSVEEKHVRLNASPHQEFSKLDRSPDL